MQSIQGRIGNAISGSLGRVLNGSKPAVSQDVADPAMWSRPSGYQLSDGSARLDVPLGGTILYHPGRHVGFNPQNQPVYWDDPGVAETWVRDRSGRTADYRLPPNTPVALSPRLEIYLGNPGVAGTYHVHLSSQSPALRPAAPVPAPPLRNNPAAAHAATVVAGRVATAAVPTPTGVALQTLADFQAFAHNHHLQSPAFYANRFYEAAGQMQKEADASGQAAQQRGVTGAHLAARANGAVVDLPRRADGQALPTFVVPDVHGRKEMIARVLSYRGADSQGIQDADGQIMMGSDGRPATVFELVQTGRANLVFDGDFVHTEGRNAERWLQADDAWQKGLGNIVSPEMTAEMEENLGTLAMLSRLKTVGGQHVQIVHGDHDEVNDTRLMKQMRGPSAPDGKMIFQSMMANEWEQQANGFGPLFIDAQHAFEAWQPFAVTATSQTEQVGITHAVSAPIPLEEGGTRNITTDDLAEKNKDAYQAVMWERNANPESVQALFDAVGFDRRHPSIQIGAHTPVGEGLYREEANGAAITINNPQNVVLAMVPAHRSFVPATDVVDLGNPYA